MRIGGSYDMRHCHGLTGIAGYVIVRIRAVAGAAEVRTDLSVLEGAGQYPRARSRVRCLAAGCARRGEEFGVDVVYDDGCRMPW